jgi:Phage terminase large subunit (GpA).
MGAMVDAREEIERRREWKRLCPECGSKAWRHLLEYAEASETARYLCVECGLHFELRWTVQVLEDIRYLSRDQDPVVKRFKGIEWE